MAVECQILNGLMVNARIMQLECGDVRMVVVFRIFFFHIRRAGKYFPDDQNGKDDSHDTERISHGRP